MKAHAVIRSARRGQSRQEERLWLGYLGGSFSRPWGASER
jgi:hypothetical protein